MKRRKWLWIMAGLVVSSGNVYADGELTPQFPRVLSISYDPILESERGERVHEFGGWNDPAALTSQYKSDFTSASHNLIWFHLTRWVDADVFPVKTDGFRYTDAEYIDCVQSWSGWHQPDGVDYRAIARDYDLARKVDSGELDEVHVHGAPYFGYWESTMAGLGGYWCNSSPQSRIACSRIFVMMGFNYERGVAEMIHSYGHRAESIMTHTYDGWSTNGDRTIWDRFGWNVGQTTISDVYGVGSVHYPPNGESDYDYANTLLVESYAPDWMNNFPYFTGETEMVNRYTWGAAGGWDYHRNFLKWWYGHFPHVAGRNSLDGYNRLNNWWEYVQNFNAYPESGGDHAPGGPTPVAEPNPMPSIRITDDTHDAWSPEVNNAGRLVWHGWDGDDFEIYAADWDGTDLVQITDNAYNDEDPHINAAGQLVWQGFDGQDYEIFTASADGSGLTQITDNSADDWHADIANSGRIVWDGFDGIDYEIFSANADGTDFVQITDNGGSYPQRPREDVWPRINNADRLVWFGYDGSDWEIFSANADGTDLVNVSNHYQEDVYPQISDEGRVVWFRYVSDDNAEIYSANATGGGVVRITNNAYHDWHPQINEQGTVVWMARPVDDWEVYSANALTGGDAVLISANENHDQYPQIDGGGRIVWQGFDGEDWEIYGWDDGTIYQITDNSFDDRAPRINDDARIAWHGDGTPGALGSTSSEIYTAPLGDNLPDVDDDDLPDDWEILQFGDLSHDGTTDEEPDGLTNIEEFTYGTDPLDADSDDDGLTDGDEVHEYGSDPLDQDSDDDGLDDAEEAALGTDPCDPDSDDDGMPDAWEVEHGTDPRVHDAADDPDNDGFTNYEEFTAGSDPMAPWSIPVEPTPGTALSFDGVDDHVMLGDVAVPGAQLTVEAWVNPRSTGSARILEKLEDFGILFTGDNVVRFMTKHGYMWDTLDGDLENEVDTWVHVACVLDGTHKSIYINGHLDTQKDYGYDVQVTSNDLIVGASSPGASQGFFDGTIDDVRLWNVGRHEPQIQATMDIALTGAESGLIGYWNFDAGGGQIAYDRAGDHDGQLGGAADPDDADPAWIESAVAPDPSGSAGPGFSDILYPGVVRHSDAAVVTVTISDADSGGDGVAVATLYYGYEWPFNAWSVSGTGPGGTGDGTWTFSIPAQGVSYQGQTLSFFLRADDGAGHPGFDSHDGSLYAIAIGVPGDSDGDGDVDLVDYAAFAGCLVGPRGGLAEPECGVFDFDADLDVDVEDFGAFQNAF